MYGVIMLSDPTTYDNKFNVSKTNNLTRNFMILNLSGTFCSVSIPGHSDSSPREITSTSSTWLVECGSASTEREDTLAVSSDITLMLLIIDTIDFFLPRMKQMRIVIKNQFSDACHQVMLEAACSATEASQTL